MELIAVMMFNFSADPALFSLYLSFPLLISLLWLFFTIYLLFSLFRVVYAVTLTLRI